MYRVKNEYNTNCANQNNGDMALHDALFCETSPGPLKYAASLLGISSSETRMPIVEIYNESKEKVKNALKVAELL